MHRLVATTLASLILTFAFDTVSASRRLCSQEILNSSTPHQIIVQVAPEVHDAALRGLCLAEEHLNANGTQLALVDVSMTETQNRSSKPKRRQQCTVGASNFAFLEHVIDEGAPSFALITANSHECDQAILGLFAESAPYWNLININVIPDLHAAYKTGQAAYFTVAPSRRLLNDAGAALLKLFDWSYAAIIVSKGDRDKTRTETLDSFRRAANNTRSFTGANVTRVLDNIKKNELFIIVSLLDDVQLESSYLCEAVAMEMVSPNYVWITMHGPRDLLSQSEKSCSKNVNRALNASFSLKIDPYPNITANEWLETGQNREDVLKKLKGDEGIDGYSYDGVTALALMLKKANGSLPFSGGISDTHLVDELREIEFYGVTGLISFDPRLSLGQVELYYYNVSDLNESTGLYIIDEHLFGLYNGSSGNATSYFDPWDSGNRPTDRITRVPIHLDKAYFIGSVVILSFAILVSLLFIAFNVAFRNMRIVRLSGPYLNVLIASAAILIYTAWILNGCDGRFFDISDSAALPLCYLRVVLTTAGFVMFYATLVVKTWRIQQMLTRQQKLQRRKEGRRRRSSAFARLINLGSQKNGIIAIVILTLLSVAIFVTWVAVDGYKREEVDQSTTIRGISSHIVYCTFDTRTTWYIAFAVYYGLILLYGLHLGIETRKVRLAYINNPWYTFLGLGSALVFTIVFFVIISVTGISSLQFVLVTLTVVFMTLTSLLLEAVPKVYAILFRGDKIVEGLGKVRGTERKSMSRHMVVAKSGQINKIKHQNQSMKDAIKMLIEQRNLSDVTVEMMRRQFVNVPALPSLLQDEDNVIEEGETTDSYDHTITLESITNRKGGKMSVTFEETINPPHRKLATRESTV
ncbi:gamma-aminobutyric acid type B receptor subunit 2-like [Oscarella lobularis]|uniref:gamma-aminobutyric acid type B receptor subunit 2-like n=1 Tax=Oscarella lobularis TaxID=121494 RepID=UPI00331434B5